MGFEQYKYDISDFIGQDVSSLSDTPSADGMSAADLKARFDNVPKMMIALGKLNGLIDYLIAGGYITKSDVELALTGMISSHEHPEKTTKPGVESVLTGEILTHEHPEKTSKTGVEAVLTGVIDTHEHTVTSDDVRFTDGQTFQQKFDSKELQGPRGYEGLLGPAGPQGVGIQGPPGPQGAPGVVVTTEINGAYQFSVEEGNLYVSYAGDVPPAFTLEDGNLYLTV